MEIRDQLFACLQQHLEPSVELLRQMVAINSFTTNHAGVTETGILTAQSFAPLGFNSERVSSVNPAYADHFVLSRPGTGTRTIGLISHLDTVFPAEEEIRNEFFWRRNGDRIYGPGTMDIKGGTVMIHLILSALQTVAPAFFNETNWLVPLNSSEEVLSRDFGKLCLERLGKDAAAALVFESGSKEGVDMAVVTGRKGRATFRLDVEGRGAHAGSRHQRGANAIVQLSAIVQHIAALTDYSRALTFNVGTVVGGTVVNRVPHFATAEIEMRAFTVEAYQAGLKSLLALNGESTVASHEGGHRCQVRIVLQEETPPWPANDGTQHLFNVWEKAAGSIGLRIAHEKRGGISDGNYIWHAVPTLDGLGPYGDNAHCSEQSADGSKQQEYVEVSSFVPRAAVTALALLRL